MFITIGKVTIRADQYRIQPDPFRYDRILDISAVKSACTRFSAFIDTQAQMARIMLQGISLGYSEKIGSQRFGNQRAVILHRISLWKMPLKEHFQLMKMDKVSRIGYYGGKERPIPLIAPQLPRPITGAGYVDRIKSKSIRLNPHLGSYLELPSGIGHGRRNGDIETYCHITGSFRHIPETSRDLRSDDNVRGHHFSGLGVPYGIHDYRALRQLSSDAVDLNRHILILLDRRLCRHAESYHHLTRPDFLYPSIRATGKEQAC